MTDNNVTIAAPDLVSLADLLNEAAIRIRAAQPIMATITESDQLPLDRARRHYQDRRRRERIFGSNDLFGEPAWDMIVDLYIAAEEGKQISVSSLCIASVVPATTALRWITILEDAGIVLRTADASDARRFYMALSAEARARLKLHFAHNC